MIDLYARLGDKYEAVHALARDTYWRHGHTETASFRMAVDAALAAVLPDLLAAAWDEGHRAGCADPYAHYHECDCRPNPYRTEGDPR